LAWILLFLHKKNKEFDMKIKVSPLVHIEIVVHDAEETYQLLNRVFGAEKVEEELSSYAETLSPFKRIIHVDLGGTVLQLIEPAESGTWQKQLKEKGPGVHNITFKVDNIQDAIKSLQKEGCEPLWQTSLDAILGSDPSKPAEPNTCMIDTMEKVGFRLELFQQPKSNI
jgi:4-hydroxyphenylpyruvate dioxygenase-like putative hemolysin